MKTLCLFYFGLVSLIPCFFLSPGCRKNTESPEYKIIHSHSIIPLPLKVDIGAGNLEIDRTTVLVNNIQFQPALNVLADAFFRVFETKIILSDVPSGKTNIQFIVDELMEPDAYQIDITSQGIVIRAKSAISAFYAAQSLRQMFWNSSQGKQIDTLPLKMMKISDKPKYAWRGFHLDVSRHFFTKEYILKIIDWLAYYKLNKLHLHLTDDQGWRIEIEQFPLLTETGAWRSFNKYDSACIDLAQTDIHYTIDKRFIKEGVSGPIYGGFYTKQDIRDIVAYASANYIDVIPEIDMPGHMSAAIRSYPYLSCVDSAGWGTEFSFPICPCNPDVMDFSYKVWDEVAELFPSEFVHIGCDEVEKGTWESSAECQNFMRLNGFTSYNEIQNFFVKKLQDHLEAKGKRVIAWDDVVDGEIDNKIIMMFWRDWVNDSPARCAGNGNSIILTPATPFYLASVNNDESLRKLYDYNPSDLYSGVIADKIIGMQSCLWTEIVPSEEMFEKNVFPRMEALAEICWSPGRDWHSFQIRMKSHFNFLNAEGINYNRPGWAN